MTQRSCSIPAVLTANDLKLAVEVERTPRVAQIVMNTSFRMFPDSDAAKGDKVKGEKPKLSAEAMALQQMMRGIHF